MARSLDPSPVVYFLNSTVLGGMEAHVRRLAVGLARRGVAVGLICAPNGEIGRIKADCRDAGVSVHEVAAAGGLFGWPRRLWSLYRVLRRYRGGILHLNLTGPHAGELLLLAGRLAGVRRIVRTEHQPSERPPSRIERWRMKLRDRAMDRIICVSRANLRHFTDDLGRDRRKFAVVYNSVDTSLFEPARSDRDARRRSLGLHDADLAVGMVARLAEERKGAAKFLQMAALIRDQAPRARFLVAGDGPLRASLEALAGGLGIADRCLFLGASGDVPELLAALDVFVMPSLWEGGPITVIEAMAAGLPIAATRVGMVDEVLADGEDGLLVEPGDVDALAAATLSLLEDSAAAREMARRAREKALAGFGEDAMVNNMLRVYHGLWQAASVPGQTAVAPE